MSKYISRLKYIKINDFFHILLFLLAFPFGKIFKLKHKYLWLISDDGNDARDNGFFLFKYIKENHPEINCAYALKKKSQDFQKVQQLGKIIPYGTFTHWIYYLSADKLISSQKSGNPNAAVCYLLTVSGLLKNKRIFLQHGITKDNIQSFYYDICKFSLFVTSTQREYEYIENNYGYKNKNIVKLLGLCRFDNLWNYKNIYNQKQILIMPTWRDWISKPVKASYKYDDVSDFTKTEYFKTYQSLLQNKQLISILEAKGITLIFYTHKHMQKYISNFTSVSEKIIIGDLQNYNVQELLMQSALLITDYSSVAFDFAYMQKPLLYYQFDIEKVHAAHYQEGYFNYENDGFGKVCKTEETLVNEIYNIIDSNFMLKEKYKVRTKTFFTLYDNHNCERNFNAIKEL